MKTLLFFAIFLFSFTFSAAQTHEYAPLGEKEFKYKNWKYKSIKGGEEIDLRDFAKGKKLVMVVYFAPWCENWKLQAPLTQKLYEKYHSSGLEIIAVGEYDTVEAMKANLDLFKITFPAVYESESKEDRLKTPHYEYRTATGDTRKWGSPWNLFLIPNQLKNKGDTLVEKAFVINGEFIKAETEAFIREKLGLPKEEIKAETAAKEKSAEVCTEETTADLKKP